MDVIKCADHIIDLGPEGGDRGGRIVAAGPPEAIAAAAESHTGRFLKRYLDGTGVAGRGKTVEESAVTAAGPSGRRS
jgi:excinuclease ABC subunit A